jgi:hypothetical protein
MQFEEMLLALTSTKQAKLTEQQRSQRGYQREARKNG